MVSYKSKEKIDAIDMKLESRADELSLKQTGLQLISLCPISTLDHICSICTKI